MYTTKPKPSLRFCWGARGSGDVVFSVSIVLVFIVFLLDRVAVVTLITPVRKNIKVILLTISLGKDRKDQSDSDKTNWRVRFLFYVPDKMAPAMQAILRSLSERDREILTRFYLHEQSQEHICQEMSLSETQFRLLKSRAKARFGEMGKRKLQQKPLVFKFHGELLPHCPTR
jgi:Sigma-70, region 4